MATIAELAVNVVARIGGLNKGLGDAKTAVMKFEKDLNLITGRIGLAITAVGGAMTAFFVSTASEIDNLAKTSKRLGLAADELMGLRLAMQLSGGTTELLDKSVEKMSIRLQQAAAGGGEASKMLEKYNLSAQALLNLKVPDRLGAIADVMQGMSTQSEKAAFAVKLFEEEGVRMVNMLEQGSDAIKEMMRASQDYSGALSSDQLKNIEDFNDSLSKMGNLWKIARINMALYYSEFAKDLTSKLSSPPEINDRQRNSGFFNAMVELFGAKTSTAPILQSEITAPKANLTDTGAIDNLFNERGAATVTSFADRVATGLIDGLARSRDAVGTLAGAIGGAEAALHPAFVRARSLEMANSNGGSGGFNIDAGGSNRAALANTAEGFRALHQQNKTANDQLAELRKQTRLLQETKEGGGWYDPFGGGAN